MRHSIAVVLASTLAACANNAGHGGLPASDAGSGGGDLTILFPTQDLAQGATDDADTGNGTDDAGDVGDMAIDPCLTRAKLVYTIDQDNNLRSFRPDKLTFNNIGVLKCPAQFGASPFSMGIDASALAWVVYTSGEIFLVDTQNGQCKPSKWVPNQGGFDTFGMGFVADKKGSLAEHLFIAGVGNQMIGVVDPIKLVPMNVGPFTGQPELTGTGDARLWGFFPDPNPRVSELDKITAKEGMTYPLQALTGSPSAWAFAFWGGDFWIFLKRGLDQSTHVYHLESANGKLTDVIPNTGYTIVGAGVSICAPFNPTH